MMNVFYTFLTCLPPACDPTLSATRENTLTGWQTDRPYVVIESNRRAKVKQSNIIVNTTGCIA